MVLRFGFEEEWHDFECRHPGIRECFETLDAAVKAVFQTTSLADPADRTIWQLGRTCAEDFQEILLLCGNGYGIAAEKLLRGMYERAVTLAYLHEHPREEQKFRNYGKVSQHKLLKIVEESLGADVFSPEQKAKIERDFQQVREQFLVTDCKKCGTYRPNHSWSKLDLVSMARTSPPLWKIIVPAYYSGLREGHSTIGAIFSRLDASSAAAGGGLIFGGESQPERADIALSMAHRIILIVLELHKDHFNRNASDEPLQKCFADFEELWKENQKVKRAE